MNCEMFFHRCSYKNSCFSELRTTPVFLCWSNDLLLEIQKICSYLKNIALDSVFLVLKLFLIQVGISLPLWIKLTMGELLLLFLCNFCSYFSYVEGVLVTNLFSLLLIDTFCLLSRLYYTRSIYENHFDL